jgi:lysophospholipase L1-like esterase
MREAGVDDGQLPAGVPGDLVALADQVRGPWDGPVPPVVAGGQGARWSSAARILGAAVLGALGPSLLVHRQFSVDPWQAQLTVLLVVVAALLALHVGNGRRGAVVPWLALAALVVGAPSDVVIVGATTALVALLGASVGYAALAEWRPWPTWPTRATNLAGLAIPPAAIATLGYGRDHVAGPTALVLLGVAGLVTASYQLAPMPVGRVDRLLLRTIVRGADLLGKAALLLVALPLLYLPGALVGLAGAVRRRFAPVPQTTWQAYDVPLEIERRDSRWLFASTPPALRFRRTVSGALVLLLVAGAAAAIVVQRREAGTVAQGPATIAAGADVPGSDPTASPNFVIALENLTSYRDLPAMWGVPWAEELQQAEFTMNSVDPVETRYLNWRDGVRRSLAPPTCRCDELDVWMLGGSAAWGQGQRDEHTIVSEIVRLAEDDAVAVRATNLGDRGSLMANTLGGLEARLVEEGAPDLVVFYVGFNEAMAHVTTGFIRGADADVGSLSFEDLTAVNGRTDEFLQWPGGSDAGMRAASHLLEARDQVLQLADEHGFEAVFVFQPDALVSPVQLLGYGDITGVAVADMLASPLAASAAEASARVDGPFLDLRGLFADHDEPTFLGLVHQNEEGARVVAEAIYAEIRSTVQELAE